MRLFVDSLIALMLVAVLGTLVWHHSETQRKLTQHQFVHRSLARLHEQAVFHAALDATQTSSRGFPLRIAPSWFGEQLPVNVLVSTRRPWLDVAPEGDSADHPPDPVIERYDQAGFWYNPHRGIFRARVERQITDRRTLELYNQVNGTALQTLPRYRDASREPVPHELVIRSLGDPADPVLLEHTPSVLTASVTDVDQVLDDSPDQPGSGRSSLLRQQPGGTSDSR